jgi:hypothetical protein
MGRARAAKAVPLPLSLVPERFNPGHSVRLGFAPSVASALRGSSLQIRRLSIQYMGLSDHGRLRLRRLAKYASALLGEGWIVTQAGY